jgi:hypothetical protein
VAGVLFVFCRQEAPGREVTRPEMAVGT